MRSLIGSMAVVVGILGAVAAAGIASKGGTGTSGPSSPNVAAVRHHLTFCRLCRESGISAERLASEDRPIPCLARDQEDR